jgi:hypothetical protein
MRESKDPSYVLGTRPGSLVRIHARVPPGLGERDVRGASGFSHFEPGTFLNLYRIAHSELTVDKWKNSTSLPSRAVTLGHRPRVLA